MPWWFNESIFLVLYGMALVQSPDAMNWGSAQLCAGSMAGIFSAEMIATLCP